MRTNRILSYLIFFPPFEFDRCIKDIQHGVKNMLSFINEIKGLALVRDAVYEILKDNQQEVEVRFDVQPTSN